VAQAVKEKRGDFTRSHKTGIRTLQRGKFTTSKLAKPKLIKS